MRGRPSVKTYLRPAVAMPGQPLQVEVVLASRSETPIDYVETTLRGTARMQVGRYGSWMPLVEQRARHGRRVLGKGEHRFASRFDVPVELPPTYRGAVAWVEYTLDVHVSIPWWPDRRQSFALPVGASPRDPAPTPQVLVSSLEGPRGSAPFFEIALESSTVEIAGVLAGAVSVSNTRDATIRGVDVVLVARESSMKSSFVHEVPRWRWRIHDGHPEEGRSLPFRIAVPRDLQVGFATPVFGVSWVLDVVADIVWGFDARMRAPLTLVPASEQRPRGQGAGARWVAPVGRERRAVTWSRVAETHGMVNDAAEERMSASVGSASLVVWTQQRGASGLYWVATLKWEPLGIELHAERRSWTNLLSSNRIDLGKSRGAAKLTARAREEAQGRAVLADGAIEAMAVFDEAVVTDDGAVLASRARAETLAQLDAFVTSAVVAAQALALGVARVPPPRTMAAFVPAWRTFASRLGGQLHYGSMRIASTSFGPEAVEVETLWKGPDSVEGTAVRVRLSPPLEAEMDLESPSTSAEARQLAKTIAQSSRSVRLGPSALEALVDGPLEDPATVEPVLQNLSALARSIRGVPQPGPFR
ncbi:MAG TPA: hypothetical protein VF765_30240 [Polyangiaceae bacterium]